MTWDMMSNFAKVMTGGRSERTWFGAECAACRRESLWLADIREGIPTAVERQSARMCYPRTLIGEPASADMPEAVRKDYDEARAVAADSPRAAAALLRLCIQRLCDALGQEGRDIHDAIRELVKQGLPVTVQQALDYVRVIGNNAVHPGKLSESELDDAVPKLFWAVNLIVDDRITRQREMAEHFGTLPPTTLKSIAEKDARVS